MDRTMLIFGAQRTTSIVSYGEKSQPIYPFSSQQKFELVVNLNTAETLRLEIPPTLLARAYEGN